MQPPRNTQPHQPKGFVVDSAQLGIVREQLNGHIEDTTADPRLGLTLVALHDMDKAADAIAERRKVEVPGLTGSYRQSAYPQPPAEPLERMLRDLRALFGARYGTWSPTMGKNRIVHGVQLTPYPFAQGFDVTEVSAAKGERLYAAGRGGARTGDGVRVGILDTPVYDHPKLVGKYLAEDGAVLLRETGRPPAWWAGHATSIAGRIVQQAPAARLDIRSVLNPDNATASVWDVAVKLADFATSGVDILNLSFGCYTEDGEPPLVLVRAIQLLTPRMVVIAAAGNHGDRGDHGGELPAPQTPMWPAALDSVVAVGATDDGGNVAPFTPKGAPLDSAGQPVVAPWVDMLARGVSVLGPYLNGTVTLPDGNGGHPTGQFERWARWSGTSFAAAAASGALAAQTVPGRLSAPEALRVLLHPDGETARQSHAIRLP
jgi:membrane-anchored mycosin MYCP